MFVTMLLAAGMLALERSENAYPRLIRGLVTPGRLLSEKILLSGGCAALVTLAMAVLVSLFVHLDWARVELWVAALALGGVAFGALGVTIGAVAREVSAASLLAFLVSLPVAFIARVPAHAVSGTLKTVLDVVSFVFPFKAALEAISNAFSATAPSIGLPLLHLAVLALAFGALARLSLRRFADDRLALAGLLGEVAARLSGRGRCWSERLALAGGALKQEEADRGDDQGDDRQRGPDHPDDREHDPDDPERSGRPAGHDQPVGPLLPGSPRGVAAASIEIAHHGQA